MLGARGWRRYRFIVIPAALPAYVAGLSQGWAFAWRGLLAGEIIVSIPEVPALGTQLNQAAVNGQSANLLALMIVVLVLGMIASFVFSTIGQRVRAKRGLTGFAAAGWLRASDCGGSGPSWVDPDPPTAGLRGRAGRRQQQPGSGPSPPERRVTTEPGGTRDGCS